jgi:hypothetical protein
VFSVYPPNAASQTPQTIPSERILVTVGAQNVYNVLNNLRAGDHQNNAANLKPRHCAHFQFKRMCNLGSECNFVHSLTPYIQGLNATMPPALRNQPVPPVQMSAHQGHGQQRQRTSVAVLTQDGHVVHVPSLAAASQRHVSPAGFTNHHQLVYQTGQPHHQQFSMQAQGHSPHSLGHVAMQLPMSTAATQYLTHSGVDAHRQGQGFQGVVLAGPPLGRGGVPPLMYFHPNQTQQLLVQVLPEAPRAVPFTQPRDGSPSFLV